MRLAYVLALANGRVRRGHFVGDEALGGEDDGAERLQESWDIVATTIT